MTNRVPMDLRRVFIAGTIQGSNADLRIDDQGYREQIAALVRARFPEADLTSSGGWLSVDGRAGLVVRGGAHPLSVYGDLVILADGPAAPLLVEGLPDGSPAAVRAAAP